MIFRENKESGLSVIELIVTLSLSIAIVVLASTMIGRLLNGQKKIAAREGAKIESLEFLALARKIVYTNLYSMHAPNSQLSYEMKTKKDDDDPLAREIKYLDVSLIDENLQPHTHFELNNKCRSVRGAAAKNLPKFTKDYIMNKVVKDTRIQKLCEDNFSLLNCSKGETVLTQVTYKNKVFSYPKIKKTKNGNFINTDASSAAIACIVSDDIGSYNTMVYYWYAISDPYKKNQKNKDRNVTWVAKEMILPPPTQGNGNYIR